VSRPLSRHEVQRDDRIVRAFLLERFVAPDEIGDEEEH
jgi:hypothetical protein